MGAKYFSSGGENPKDKIETPADRGFEVAHIERTNGNTFIELGEGSSTDLSVRIFSGPKSYTLLKDLGFELRRLSI